MLPSVIWLLHPGENPLVSLNALKNEDNVYEHLMKGRIRTRHEASPPESAFQSRDRRLAEVMSEGLPGCHRRTTYWRMCREHESMDRACPSALLPSHNACFKGTQRNLCDVQLHPMRRTRARYTSQAQACHLTTNNDDNDANDDNPRGRGSTANRCNPQYCPRTRYRNFWGANRCVAD
jgi:hypothetical protein